jgi:hypothetical protein
MPFNRFEGRRVLIVQICNGIMFVGVLLWSLFKSSIIVCATEVKYSLYIVKCRRVRVTNKMSSSLED